ncbi:GNAT family N-acetyltransferase [Candidatus Halobonum tyrrellensis]|uniref:N-acetyltransferase domain-containing protein n=1 Tax=Candidatus Halobonum tyrrellensis G22 TaxID=1324957 RepID=V4HKB6_9EURY|nr:GNAT family N-acetyltransferase [Candidatus Halobonum tyrrellensis]ESP88334.1 hypothetical protein K933_09432 [Candidatus Halobonum tyrrellensis G22]
MEYRPVPDDHEETYRAALSYAFAPQRGPDPDRDAPDRPAGYARRGLYDVPPGTPEADLDAADLAVVCGYHDFSARIRGGFRPVGGVSAVASPPEFRRRGLVREMLSALHAELRDDGVAFAALWPFEYPFYARLGYARANDYARVDVPPSDLGPACPPAAGEFVRLAPDDWERLDAVHAEAATEALALDRTEEWWRTRVFQGWETDPFAYGWEREDGDLRGYLVYSVEDADDADGRRLSVSEFAAVDREARGHLLRFCRNHDSQVSTVRLQGRADLRLFDELDDPRAAETSVRPGPMVRLVDVPAALDSLAYPADAEGSVVLDVADDTCAWNDGRFRLTVGGGTAACEPTDADPDVSLGVGALSRLAVGSHAAPRLDALGDLTADAPALATLAAAFPPEPTFLREGF